MLPKTIFFELLPWQLQQTTNGQQYAVEA